VGPCQRQQQQALHLQQQPQSLSGILLIAVLPGLLDLQLVLLVLLMPPCCASWGLLVWQLLLLLLPEPLGLGLPLLLQLLACCVS
jgi:hypothetical protein